MDIIFVGRRKIAMFIGIIIWLSLIIVLIIAGSICVVKHRKKKMELSKSNSSEYYEKMKSKCR